MRGHVGTEELWLVAGVYFFNSERFSARNVFTPVINRLVDKMLVF